MSEMIPFPSFSRSNITRSPTAIGFVVEISLSLIFPFILHSKIYLDF